MLHLYNTLNRYKERFVPIDANRVRMYVCGPTVYDVIHVGNARSIVVFDILYRVLRMLYGNQNVKYVRNITDIDDKINLAAKKRGVSIEEITKPAISAFHRDIIQLNTLQPTVEPRATDHIPEMINMIETLIIKNHAYEIEGHVLFHVPSMANHGMLSQRDRDKHKQTEIVPYKKNQADFVLWKPSPPDLPGWSSPWGRGRPGWHLECSAMSKKYLGPSFDIHGGGQDLIFPHHENEISQSLCAHPNSKFANFWVHNGYVQTNGEKMAKSLNNVLTVQQLLSEGYTGDTIRLALLSTHYRRPMEITYNGLRQAKRVLDRLYTALRAKQEITQHEVAVAPDSVISALEDDLNTPLAINHLHKLVRDLNKANGDKQAELKGFVLGTIHILGLLEAPALQKFGTDEMLKQINDLVNNRNEARQRSDFADADKIRDKLIDKGIILEDKPDGTTWKYA